MKPEAIAENVAPAAVAMSLFFVLGVWSATNMLRTKCKLYEVLFASAVLRAISYALHIVNLVSPRRVLYVTFQSLESIGYGISVAVLFLAIFQFLRTSEQPRPPHARALSAFPLVLIPFMVALSVVLAPVGFALLYERDDPRSNYVGEKLLLASFWGRVAILVVWFTFLTGVMLNALWSFHKSRSTVKAGEEPLAEHAWQTSQPAPTSGLRSVLQHRSLSVLDGRLLVPVVWVCLVLEAWALAIQVARLYHTYLNQDRYNYSLTVLPQYLELVILNLPGVLWRLSFGPSHPRSEAARLPA